MAGRKGRERVSSRPTAGALEGLLLPSEENPSPPRHPEKQNAQAEQSESAGRLNCYFYMQSASQSDLDNISECLYGQIAAIIFYPRYEFPLFSYPLG